MYISMSISFVLSTKFTYSSTIFVIVLISYNKEMVDKIEETVLEIKTPGLNNPETSVLTQNRFITYMVLNFSVLNKAQVYKMPYRNSPLNEIEILLSFNYLNLFRLKEDVEVYHVRKPQDAIFLFEIEAKKSIHVGDRVFTFETTDIKVKHSSELGFNDVKYPFAYGQENIYFMLHQQ